MTDTCNISGPGSVIVDGYFATAPVILTGTDDAATTTVENGATLQIGNIESSGIVDNGTLVFACTGSGISTVSGNITGSGSVVRGVPGWNPVTVVLTGAGNTWSGGTTISNGTLQIGDGTTNGSIAGSIVDNAILDFVQNAAATFNNTISGGSGSVIENSGAGELTLTGLNAFYGSLGGGIQT